MLILLSGCSGAGKNTVIDKLLERNKNLCYLKSCTSREKEQRDIEKSPYIHLTKEEFEEKIKNNELFEYEEIHGNYYGLLKSTIDDAIQSDKNFIKDIGVIGQKNMVQRLDHKLKIVSIFLDVPKQELINRLKLRGEKNIEKRMERFEFESAHRPNFNLIIQNDNLDKTLQIIEKILNKNEQKSEF